MKKRQVLKLFGSTVWVTPIISSISLPLHAMMSGGINISVEMLVPEFRITISDDSANFSYSYQLNDGAIIAGDSGSETSVIINDILTGQFAGTTQVVTVSVTDSDGNMVQEAFSFDIEG